MEDYEKVNHILRSVHNPLRDHKEMRSSIDSLAQILTTTSSPQLKQRIEFGLLQLQENATRYLLHPSTIGVPIRAALIQVALLADQALGNTTYTNRMIAKRSSLQQSKKLHSLAHAFTDFTYIPFSYTECSGNEIAACTEELVRKKIPAQTEKVYSIIPLYEKSNEELWNIDMVGAPKTRDKVQDKTVLVGIVDTGCDYNHEEIAHCFGNVKGYNFVNNTDDPFDDNDHGTHVGGTIAGKNVGVAPHTTLYALKFLDGSGSGREVDFLRAAEWAIEHELDILNGSFGSTYASSAEEAMCRELEKRNILFAAAAGNDGNRRYSYPASYPSVMSVAAIDRQKDRAPFSQYNDQVSLSGPGVTIYSCVPGGFDRLSGTSMATPHVAGALSTIYDPQMSAADHRELLTRTADELGAHDEYGSGLVRVDKALGVQKLFRRNAA